MPRPCQAYHPELSDDSCPYCATYRRQPGYRRKCDAGLVKPAAPPPDVPVKVAAPVVVPVVRRENVRVEARKPAPPRKVPLLGDAVKSALSTAGITEERVSEFLGAPCGCAERRRKLNDLQLWAEGKLADAGGFLSRLLGGK